MVVLALHGFARMKLAAISISIVAAGCSGSGHLAVGPDADTGSAHVTIDGQEVVISKLDAFNYQGSDNLSIKFTGTGIAAGTDIDIAATHPGTGCNNTMNFITYRPESAPQYMPSPTTVSPGCGLTISAISENGARIAGTFSGTLYSINSSPQTTHVVTATFDAPVPQH